MDVDFAFFADSAVVPPDGKVYVLGGGFSNIAVPKLPQQVGFAVVARFRFSAEDAGRAHRVELRFVDADSRLVVPPVEMQFQSAGPPPDPTVEITLPTVAYLRPMLAEPGRYAVEYWSGDRRLYSASITVQEQEQPQLGPRPN